MDIANIDKLVALKTELGKIKEKMRELLAAKAPLQVRHSSGIYIAGLNLEQSRIVKRMILFDLDRREQEILKEIALL